MGQVQPCGSDFQQEEFTLILQSVSVGLNERGVDVLLTVWALNKYKLLDKYEELDSDCLCC